MTRASSLSAVAAVAPVLDEEIDEVRSPVPSGFRNSALPDADDDVRVAVEERTFSTAEATRSRPRVLEN